MSNPFQIIEKCCDDVRERVKITRGSFVIWDNDRPVAVNGLGAVLLFHDKLNEPQQWKWLQDFLGVDPFWLYKFCIGWDAFNTISILDENLKIIGIDEVSAKAKKMYRRFAQ